MIKKNEIIFKVNIDWGGTIIVILITLYIFYSIRVWEFQSLIRTHQIYGLSAWLFAMYLYGQYRTTSYQLYEDKIVIKFPLRPLFNKYEFLLTDIDSILFYDINTLSVFSSMVIKCSGRKRKKYRFPSTGDDTRMVKLLNLLEEKGILVEIKKISGYGNEPK